MRNAVSASIEAAHEELAGFSCDKTVDDNVMSLTRIVVGSGLSPCDDTLILARTLLSAALGMGGAIEGGLHPTEILDRDTLRHTVCALRASADIFDAVLREGAQ